MNNSDPNNWLTTWERKVVKLPIVTPTCCIYDGDPLFEGKDVIKVPVKKLSDGSIQYCGVCCSLACAYAFIDMNKHLFTHESQPLLVEMARDMYNIRQPLIKARPIFTLIKYGGYLSIEQFRSYGPQHYSSLRAPPFFHLELQVEDMIPRMEVPTKKSKQQFLEELEEAKEQASNKKKRYSEKVYQSSLECLIKKRAGDTPTLGAKSSDVRQNQKTVNPFAQPSIPDQKAKKVNPPPPKNNWMFPSKQVPKPQQ